MLSKALKNLTIIILVQVIAVFCFLTLTEAGIVLRTIVTNPSADKIQTIPVRAYLPQGVAPENIIDRNNFEIGYDFEKSLYYVTQRVELAPKQSLTLSVEIEDIWVIAEDELESWKNHLKGLMAYLEKTKYYESAKILDETITEDLETIRTSQTRILTDLEEYMSRYERNQDTIKEVKRNIAILEDLIIELGADIPNKMLLGEVYLGEVYDEAEILALGRGEIDIEALDTVNFNISITNPSFVKTQVLPLKHYLPKEVKTEYIVDRGGLDLGYDVEKKLYYLYREGIELEAGQARQFIVVIRNVWFIPEEGINFLRARAGKAIESLEGSIYYETASYLSMTINNYLDEIIRVQNIEGLTTEAIIGNYRLNLKRLNSARKDLNKLERILVQAGGRPAAAFSEIIGLGAEAGRGAGAGFVSMADRVQAVGRSIFRGKIPSVSVTWTLIYYIIGFLAVVSFSFFILQFVQHKQLITDTLTGSYTRKYINGKLPEELSKGRLQHSKYAVLMIDIDGFKGFNDKYGHLTGDTILRETVTVLKKNLRPVDIIGRFGGDEFIIGLPDRSKEDAGIIAERLVQAVSSHRIRVRLEEEAFLITISVGIAVFPEDSDVYEVLINKADEALYQAKGRGGNRVFVYAA